MNCCPACKESRRPTHEAGTRELSQSTTILCPLLKTTLCMCVFVVSTSATPWTVQPARLLCPQNFLSKNPGVWVATSYSGDLPDRGVEPHLSCLQHLPEGSLPLSPLGRPLLVFILITITT